MTWNFIPGQMNQIDYDGGMVAVQELTLADLQQHFIRLDTGHGDTAISGAGQSKF